MHHWKEESERIKHIQALVGGERVELRAICIEGRVGECVRDGLKCANPTSVEIERR